jgi:hypothetical protein
MSTTPITNLGSVIANGGDPSDAYQQDAPPAAPTPQADPATLQQVATGNVAQATPAPQPSGSRLGAIVQAVAKVASTALSGIPNQGRPSFVTGLGEGARAEQAAQANQQAIKFRNFDDQVRLAQLHNQDIKLQNDTQAQTDAHTKAELDNRTLAESLGIDYDTIPSDGKTVMDHLTAQTAGSGAASVPAGTHLSGDGSTVNIPQNTQATRDGQKQMYGMLGPALGLPSLPPSAQFVPKKYMDYLTNKIHGYGLDGNPIKHDDLPSAIGAMQAQRDQLVKNGGSPQQLQAIDNTLGIYKANLDALDKHAAGVKQQSKAAELAAETSPENIAGQAKLAGAKAKAEYPYKAALQDNAASNKTSTKPQQSVVGFDPQSNERVVVNANDPRATNLQQSGKVSSQQMDQWGTSQNQFANVQLAVSRYDQAARNFAQSGKPSDAIGINSALNKAGVGDVQIGEWGVKVPGFSSVAEAASRVANSTAFKNLSPAGQDLVDKYFRMMSSIPEYQKASTGIGRTNKEMLDLELKNIPDPTMPPSIISNRLSSFQEALGSNASRVPKIQGVPHYKDVQQHYQQQTQTPPGGSDLGNPTDFVNRLVPSNQ